MERGRVPTLSRPQQSAEGGGAAPTQGTSPGRRKGTGASQGDAADLAATGGQRGAARATKLQLVVLVSLPTPKPQTALAAPGSQPSLGL